MSQLWKSWKSLSKGAKWAWVTIIVVTVLVVLPLTVELGIAAVFGGPDAEESGWTAGTEKALLEGCKMADPQDLDLPRFCACILVDMKKANRSPSEAADVSERILHNKTVPAWAKSIISGCQ
jgi:hypothetical protein